MIPVSGCEVAMAVVVTVVVPMADAAVVPGAGVVVGYVAAAVAVTVVL